MDLSETQYRIWKDIDLRALKIDDSFITNKWQIFPCLFFPTNRINIEDLILFAHQFCRYVEHFLQCEICGVRNGILIVLESLSHECRWIHRHGHKHSPNYRMFFSLACKVGHSFLSFSHLIIHSSHEFCCITSHDENFGMCHFLRVVVVKLPWSITKWFSVPDWLLGSVEKNFLMTRTNVLQHSPRSFVRLPWSIVRRTLRSPLLRRSNSVIIQFFWIFCWREIPRQPSFFTRLPWSSIFHNWYQWILISVMFLPRAHWNWRRHERRRPRNKIHHRSWFGCGSFFSWILLSSFCHCSGASCRAEMANAKQIQQMIPLITRETTFGQDVSQLVFGVGVFGLDLGIQIASIKQPIKCNTVSPGNMSQCKTLSF